MKKKKKQQNQGQVNAFLKAMSQKAKVKTVNETSSAKVTNPRDALTITQRENIPQAIIDVKSNVAQTKQDLSQVEKTYKIDLYQAKVKLNDWPLLMKQDSLIILAAKKINDIPLDLQIANTLFANVYINQNGSVKNMSAQTMQVFEQALVKWPDIYDSVTGLPQIDNVFYFLRFSDQPIDDKHPFNDSLFLIQKTQIRSPNNLEKDQVVVINFVSWNITKIDKNYKAIVLQDTHAIFKPQAYGHIQYKTNKHTLLNYGGLKIVGEGQTPLKLTLQEGIEADTNFIYILTKGLVVESNGIALYGGDPTAPPSSEAFTVKLKASIGNSNTYSLNHSTFTYAPSTPLGFDGIIKNLSIPIILRVRATGFTDNTGVLHPFPINTGRQMFDLEFDAKHLVFDETTKTAKIYLGAGVRHVTFDAEIDLPIGNASGRQYSVTTASTMDVSFESGIGEAGTTIIFDYKIKDNNQIILTPNNSDLQLIVYQLNEFFYTGTNPNVPYMTKIHFGLEITSPLKTGAGVFEVITSQNDVAVVPMIPIYKTQTSKDNITPTIRLYTPYFDRTINDIQNVGALIYRLKGTSISTSWIKDDAIYGYGTNKPDISFTNIYYSRMFFWMWYFTFGYQRNFGYAVYSVSSNDFWGSADSRPATTLPAKFTDFRSTAEGGLYLAETLLTAVKAVATPEQFGNVMLDNYRQQFGLSLDTGTGKVIDNKVPYNYTLFNFFSEQIFWNKLLNNGTLQGNGIYSVLSFHLVTYYLQPTWNRNDSKNTRYKSINNDPTPYLIGQFNQQAQEGDTNADGVGYVNNNCPLSMFSTTPRTQSTSAPFPPLIISVAITNIWFNNRWYHEDFKFTDSNLNRELWDFQASSGDNTSYLFKDIQGVYGGGDFPKLYLTDEASNMNVKHLTNNGNKIQVLPLPNPILDKSASFIKNEFDTEFINNLFIFPQPDCSKWPSNKFMDKDDLIKYFKDSTTDQLNIVAKIEMDDTPVLLKKATKKKKALYKVAAWPVTFQLKQIDLRGIYGGDGNVLLLDSQGNTLIDINALEKSQFQYFDEENDTNSLTQIFILNDDD